MRHRLKLPQALRWRRRHGVGRSRELGRSSQITVSGRGNTHGRSSFAASARTKSLRGIRKKDFVFLLFGFDKAICSKEFDNGVHFYLEDSKFERMWRNPYRYIPILKRFSFVLTPDFSIYTDMPEAMQIWNIFRSRLLGQMLQREGMTLPVYSVDDDMKGWNRKFKITPKGDSLEYRILSPKEGQRDIVFSVPLRFFD